MPAGAGMFPRLGYARVWGKRTAALAGMTVPAPSGKALRDLRRRIGPAPPKALFEVVAGPPASSPRPCGTRSCGTRKAPACGAAGRRQRSASALGRPGWRAPAPGLGGAARSGQADPAPAQCNSPFPGSRLSSSQATGEGAQPKPLPVGHAMGLPASRADNGTQQSWRAHDRGRPGSASAVAARSHRLSAAEGAFQRPREAGASTERVEARGARQPVKLAGPAGECDAVVLYEGVAVRNGPGVLVPSS